MKEHQPIEEPKREESAPVKGVVFQSEPAIDEHLEDLYDMRQGEGVDFDFDYGMEDYEPNPYDGTYSEE